MIPLFKHNLRQEDIDRCVEVLKSDWHTAGPVGEKVEKLISEYYEKRFKGRWTEPGPKFHTALTSSCTSGLMAVALAIGLKKGDEVITTPMTFSATSASFMHYGAVPVFVDIDPETGLIDVDQIENKITKNTKAIYSVNLYGHMPNNFAIHKIAKKHKLFFLEDCAHAFDSLRDELPPATYSDAAVFSFYATKNTHCGEGGAVISRNKDLIEKVKVIRRHGLSKWPQPGVAGNMGYDIVELGFKGTLSDILAALLESQIEKSDLRRQARENIAQSYYNRFKNLKFVKCVMPPATVKSSWYTFPLKLDSYLATSALMGWLIQAEIGHTVMYQSLETLRIYRDLDLTSAKCPIAREFGEEQISIPCHSNLTAEQIEKIIKTVEDWDKECSS